MDILSDMLGALRLTGGIRYNAVLGAPWGVEIHEQKELVPFYVVVQGAAVLELNAADSRGQGSLALSTGDLVMLPQGREHTLKDSPGSVAVPLSSLDIQRDEAGERIVLRHGGNDRTTNLIAGEFRFNTPIASSFLADMDPVVCVKASSSENSNDLELNLRLLCREQRSDLPGARAATAELLKLLFLQILRSEMAERRSRQKPCKGNSFALMFDPALRGAVEALHRAPERPWTVAALAAEAAMSRTSFALRFSESARMSPFAYLTRLRMMRAIELLEDTDATLEEIADRVGYGSEAAFSTAFKRELGMAPGAYRRRRADVENPSFVRQEDENASMSAPDRR